MRYDLFRFDGNVGSESYVTDQGIPAPSVRGVVKKIGFYGKSQDILYSSAHQEASVVLP